MKSSESLRLLAVGELLWDVLPAEKRCGGAPGNIVYHAGLQKIDARLCSAVGRDPAGEELLDLIRRRGLHDDFLSLDSSRPTGRVTVTLKCGIPRYTIHAPAAWDAICAGAEVRRFAESVQAFCFGSLAQRNEMSRDTIQELAALTPPHALRVFDVNLRQDFYSEELIRNSLEASNVLKLSDEELPVLSQLLGLPGEERAALTELLRRFSLRFILYTLGARGSVFFDGTAYLKQDVVNIGPIVDTVGCGDSYLASFLAAYLRGVSPEQAMRHAATVSGMIAARRGAMPDDAEFLEKTTESLRQIL